MSFYPPGSNGFVDVRDLSEIILKLMNTDIKYERFIINGETVSYKELFHKIASALKVDPPRKELKPFVAAVAWRAEKLRAMISRDEPRITQESIKASFSRQNYSSQKLLGVIDHTFRPIDDTIHHVTSLMENGPGESLYSSKNMEHL
jgi:nucleoside-diphosphate-sugar epimerase